MWGEAGDCAVRDRETKVLVMIRIGVDRDKRTCILWLPHASVIPMMPDLTHLYHNASPRGLVSRLLHHVRYSYATAIFHTRRSFPGKTP